MKITKAPIFIAPVRPTIAAKLGDFVADDKHHIALSGGLVRDALGLPLLTQLTVEPEVTFKAVSPDIKLWAPAQRLALAKAFATAGTSTLPTIKTYFPTAAPAVEGFEFVFHSIGAVHAWSDPKQTSVLKPILKTSRAVVELFDLLKMAAPALDKASPHVQAISVFVKVGDTLYQLYTDIKGIENDEKAK